jgi:hypothetical protein
MSTPRRSFGTRSGRLTSPSSAEKAAKKLRSSAKKLTREDQDDVEQSSAALPGDIDDLVFPLLPDARGIKSSTAEANVAALALLLQNQQQELAALRAERASHTAATATKTDGGSRFARREPRAADLQEYDGSSGAKLEGWLEELTIAVRLFRLNPVEAVDFGSSRLRGAALQWWMSLSGTDLAKIGTADSLGAALRARFQPVTAQRVAREQLRALKQGSRTVNDYIAEFQRLHALLPGMDEADALFAFENGLSGEAIKLELRKAGTEDLKQAIAMAARVGGITATSSPASSSSWVPSRGAAANQMDIDSESSRRLDRLEATLNAIAAAQGTGAKTQTQHGYQQERVAARGRYAGHPGSRGGGSGGPYRPPSVPGVPAAVIQQRKAANQCYRCGSAEHTRFDCPNAISSSGSSF